MCLYPRKYINKKYTATKKNAIYVTDIESHIIPSKPIIGKDSKGNPIYDERVNNIEIPCGNCIECRKQLASDWRVRMTEEIKCHQYNYFITLTFSNEELIKLVKFFNCCESNRIAGYAVRRFLERWRKKYKKSVKHWLITELGHQNTERIHLHGILFCDMQMTTPEIQSIWKYGEIWVGEYCNLKTINYIVKYVTKIDNDHKGFQGQILCSPGIGAQWVKNHEGDIRYQYRPGRTRTDYVLNTGTKIKMPTYYKNKMFTEEERELIWRDFMDMQKISIRGQEHKLKDVEGHTLNNIISKAQEVNISLQYGDDSPEYRRREYNITKRMYERQIKREFAEKCQKILQNHKK